MSSADSEMVNQRKLAPVGGPVARTLRIDLVSATTFRIRYAEGRQVPENTTPMVVAWPKPSGGCAINLAARVDVEAPAVELKTPAMTLSVCLDPLRIGARDFARERGLPLVLDETGAFWPTINTGIYADPVGQRHEEILVDIAVRDGY